ncbi:hypothetical protein BKA62DRAFT_693179 [Auriculariales sp. MPI-PUGE-AT-0066]|nr:hypothetical protein BKA62DRAFT_693179 [Auriculariales sp. MPI-PUGE-AT-0066]
MHRLIALSLVFSSVTLAAPRFATRQPAGMVALGVIPSDARDSFGETLGGLGSAIYIKRGKYSIDDAAGVLVLQPDRGFNVLEPIPWQGRFHTFSFQLKPYYDTANLSFDDAQSTLELEYTKTRLYTDKDTTPVSGADALAERPSQGDDPILPIFSTEDNRISFDPEGIVQNADGSYFVSEEYGPMIHLFDSTGQRILSFSPPDAVLPRISGNLNFTSSRDPDRWGLTASSDGTTLYALLQSALMQDGGSSDSKLTNRYTRLFAWDISALLSKGDKKKSVSASAIKLIEEYVVPLPQSSKGKTRAQSEIYYLNNQQFLVLARDGDGHGSDELSTGYKNIDIFDISNATNIVGLYDGPTDAVAPGGQLRADVTPASYQAFVNLADDTQLARFGLHNGKPADATLINAKWESIALTPVGDAENPDDYFLFAVSDNDFITTNGISLGEPYSQPEDVDTQIIVYRVTLPTVPKGSVERAISLDG